jgi:hypothetical protein
VVVETGGRRLAGWALDGPRRGKDVGCTPYEADDELMMVKRLVDEGQTGTMALEEEF